MDNTCRDIDHSVSEILYDVVCRLYNMACIVIIQLTCTGERLCMI